MYAVIETGGKQVRVQAGDIIQVEKLTGDVGSKVTFDKVLFVSQPSENNSEVILGAPYINQATVEAEILAQGRDKKVTIVKMKRRKQYRRTQGHRQDQTQLIVTAMNAGSAKAEMSATDKKVKLAKFFSNLTPRGGFKQSGFKKETATEAKATAPKTTAAKAKTTTKKKA